MGLHLTTCKREQTHAASSSSRCSGFWRRSSALVLIYLSYRHQHGRGGGGQRRPGADRGAGHRRGRTCRVSSSSGVNEAVRPTSGTFNARVGGGRVFVTFRSEAARVDLNAAPKSLLAGLITGLGANPANAARLCRPHHRLAHADRGRRKRSRKFVLPDLGRTLSAAACAIPGRRRNCGWCAGSRRW